MLTIALLVTSFGWVDSSAVTYDIRPKSRLTVQETVAQMVDLLESKKYRQLIEEYAHPETLADVQKEKLMDEVVRVMVEDGLGDQMLTALKKFEAGKLIYNEDNTEAVFHVPNNDGNLEDLTFEKHEGEWYVKE